MAHLPKPTPSFIRPGFVVLHVAGRSYLLHPLQPLVCCDSTGPDFPRLTVGFVEMLGASSFSAILSPRLYMVTQVSCQAFDGISSISCGECHVT